MADNLTPSIKTGEGATNILGALGAIGSGAGLAVELVQDPTMPWYGKVIVVCALLAVGAAKGLGLLNARTNLKLQEMLGAAPKAGEGPLASPQPPSQ